MSTAPKIKVGILLNGLEVPAWQESLIRRLVASEDAEIVFFAVRTSSVTKKSLWKKLTHDFNTLIYRVYSALDANVFHASQDAFDARSIADLANTIPTVYVTPVTTKHTDTFTDADIATLKAYQPEVILRLGFRILRGGILALASAGVWSYHHGDPDTHRGAPPCFWEVMERAPVTGSMLQILSEELDNGRILYRSWSSTDRYSVHRSKNIVYWKSIEFILRCLRKLRVMGTDTFLQSVAKNGDPFYGGRMYKAPQNFEALKLISAHVIRAFWMRAMEALRPRQWIVRYGSSTHPESTSWSTARFTDMLPPAGSFWADPCIVVHHERPYIFFEDYSEAEKRGSISVCEIGTGHGTALPAIVEPFHLSHPDIFQWNGDWYCVPESAEHRTVDLYRCIEFPHRWEKVQSLMTDSDAVDATLFEYEGKWWMFVNLRPHPMASSWDELHLYHASSPTGPWTPHSANPVVSDARCARPAGRIFARDGVLYRPAQDCSGGYGSSVRIQRIIILTTENYREEPAWHLEPERWRGFEAMHTVSIMGKWIAVDEQRRV